MKITWKWNHLMRSFLDKMWTLFFMIRSLGPFQIEDDLAFIFESTCPSGVNSSYPRHLDANAEGKKKKSSKGMKEGSHFQLSKTNRSVDWNGIVPLFFLFETRWLKITSGLTFLFHISEEWIKGPLAGKYIYIKKQITETKCSNPASHHLAQVKSYSGFFFFFFPSSWLNEYKCLSVVTWDATWYIPFSRL